MKVSEMIAKLQEQDPDGEIEFVIEQYNKVYPVAYVPVSDREYPITTSPHHTEHPKTRIWLDLPKNMRTSVLKEKAVQA